MPLGDVNFINLVNFTSDGKTLICVTKEKLFLWNIKENTIEGTPKYNDSQIKSLSIHSKGKFFATGDIKGKICIWELNSSSSSFTQKLEISNAHGTPDETPINSLTFNPKGSILASAGDDNKIKLWNPNNSKEIKTLGEHSCLVTIITFSRDGTLLASGDDEGEIKIWDIKTRKLKYSLEEHKKAIITLAFSPDNEFLVSGSRDKNIKVWRL